MEDREQLIAWLLVWAGAIALVMASTWRSRLPGVGLPIAYVSSLAVLHWFGGLIYALPWYTTGVNAGLVQIGFAQSTYGVVAFTVGTLVFGPALVRVFSRTLLRRRRYAADRWLPLAYCLTGAFFYVVLQPILEGIPSIRTLAYSGWSLVIAGMCLGCWQAWSKGSRRALAGWLLASLSLPAFMLVSEGFLSYGNAAITVIVMFVVRFYRPRWVVAVTGLLAIYFGLSFFVTYFRDRDELRAVMWYREGGASNSGEILRSMLTRFELFDPHDPEHLWRIDARLNQNWLVGAAVAFLESGGEPYAKGATLRQALEAMVPRILWPEKQVVAGSMGLVSKYTGRTFSEGTSVGMGQVLEFYVNFGTPCVVIGFLILGTVIRVVDAAAGNRLVKGDSQGFLYWFLPGLALLQAGGSLVDVTGVIASVMVFSRLINALLPRLQRRVPAPASRRLSEEWPPAASRFS